MNATTRQPTLAAFKRRVRTGTIIDAVGHHNPAASGRRIVDEAGATRFRWHNELCPRSWTQWPKAKHVRVDGPDTVTLLFEDGREMSTLTIIEDSTAPIRVPKPRQPLT